MDDQLRTHQLVMVHNGERSIIHQQTFLDGSTPCPYYLYGNGMRLPVYLNPGVQVLVEDITPQSDHSDYLDWLEAGWVVREET